MPNRRLTYTLQPFLAEYAGHIRSNATAGDIDYRAISIDSRSIQPGELFVAIVGERLDGHQYVEMALEKGAGAAVVAKSLWKAPKPAGSNLPLIWVEDTLDFLQQLAAWHRRRFHYPVIGITGSNGKTTTREMIAAILSQKYRVFRSTGNMNNHIGLPLMLLKMDDAVDIAVIEMGSNHPGEIWQLSMLAAPTAGVITNIGKGHLGFFGDLEAIFREKTALFDRVGRADPIFLNTEDDHLCGYPREGRNVITVGFSSKNRIWGRIDSLDSMGRASLKLYDELPVQLLISGEHNGYNALIAAAVGLFYGVERTLVKTALEAFQPASQRMEVYEKKGILIINDAYNANPDSMRAAIEFLACVQRSGKRIAVLGDMLELGEFSAPEHRALGAFLATLPIDVLLTYGEDARMILEGAKDAVQHRMSAKHCETHADIAHALKPLLGEDDALLLKGSRGMRLEETLRYLAL